MIKSLPPQFKKLVILIIVIAGLLGLTDRLHAQEINFKYKVDSVQVGSKTNYTITIISSKLIPNYIAKLYEETPNEYKLIDNKEVTNSKVCSFYVSEHKKWVVIIELNKNRKAIFINF